VSAANSIHETGYLMGIADSQDYVQGVVAWIDMLGRNAADDIRYWSRFRKLKGFRPYLQDLAEDDWVLKPELKPAIRAMKLVRTSIFGSGVAAHVYRPA
jgi:L-fuconolactonase